MFSAPRSHYREAVLMGGPRDGERLPTLGVPAGIDLGADSYYFSFEEGGRHYYLHGSEVDWSRR